MNKPTRYYSKQQENRVAKDLNMKKQSNSGATTFYKGDIVGDSFLVECKTKTTSQKSIVIKKEMIEKLKEEAFAMGKSNWALAFSFGDGEDYFSPARLRRNHDREGSAMTPLTIADTRLFTVLSDAASQCDRAAPVIHKFGGLTVAAEGWESPGERWFYAFYVTVLEQLKEETEKNGNYIFDSPRYPGYISTYGADKTNAHKEIAMINQVTGNSAHQPREGFMAPTFRIFVRTAEGSEFQAFTWCRDEASGIARAWREGREFGHNVAAVWAEAV